MPKKTYRVRNWKDYNQALVKRGSLTFWFDEEALQEWKKKEPEGSGKKGRPLKYSNAIIESILTVRAIFNLPFRATEGFMQDITRLLNLEMKAPTYSLLCKRQKSLPLNKIKRSFPREEKLTILVDATGLKIFGEGEWKVRQHGWDNRRRWKKLHLGVNSKTQEIEAFELTDPGVQDCQAFPKVINKIEGDIEETIGDGAYDRFSCYELSEQKKFRLITPPQHNARTSKEKWDNRKKASPNAVKKRDDIILRVREKGKASWKTEVGYHRRSLAETTMFRLKTLLGGSLRSRKIENQKIETGIWCNILNKMLVLGMPKTVAVF